MQISLILLLVSFHNNLRTLYIQEFYHFLQHRRQNPKSLKCDQSVVSKSIFRLVTVNKYHNESVEDYHVGSHAHALRFLFSGVARSGKTPVPLLQIHFIVRRLPCCRTYTRSNGPEYGLRSCLRRQTNTVY